jgi:hypothetical protein
VIALANELVVVDPPAATPAASSTPRHAMEAGRQFCTAPFGEGTIVRGADGSHGGWAALLFGSEWKTVAPGPEAAPVAPDVDGGLAWVVGAEMHRRAVDESDSPPHVLDATGCLLAIDPQGRALLRDPNGQAVRVDAGGRVLERIPGPVLCVDALGATLTIAGLDRRDAEIATGMLVLRWLGDGSRGGPYPIAVKTSPVLDPPVLAAALRDGSILLLGATPRWRREPGHDWWGASVERWDPVWVGEIPLQ